MFFQLFSLQNKSFLCLQHVENKGFQTVIKHRLKDIQKPIKNELGNRKKKHKKCTFRFEKMHISFSRLYIIKYFLDIISPNNDMLDKMNSLFATFPEIDKAALGFPFGWENEPLWQ